jgi:hypothetical protein
MAVTTVALSAMLSDVRVTSMTERPPIVSTASFWPM